jgi:hypothetical protein
MPAFSWFLYFLVPTFIAMRVMMRVALPAPRAAVDRGIVG